MYEYELNVYLLWVYYRIIATFIIGRRNKIYLQNIIYYKRRFQLGEMN